MKCLRITLFVIGLASSAGWSMAAQDAVSVPALSGLTVPQAAAALNRAGLALGVETSGGWTPDSGVQPNTVASQTPAAGELAAPGSAVSISVLRAANVTLIYDDNDITLLNASSGTIPLAGMTFNSIDGTSAAFDAANWAGALDASECVQLWSIAVSAPKDVAGCTGVASWRSTQNAAVHFWTMTNGVNQFQVVQNGVARATCPAAAPGAPPLTCEVYITGGSGGDDVTPYLYFAYTPDRLIVHNRSTDRWMPTTGSVIYNLNPNIAVVGAGIPLDDASIYPTRSLVADPTRLAPGQCLLFTDSTSPDTLNLPEACDVVARIDIGGGLAFWLAPFELGSVNDGRRRSCDAALPGTLTICILPR